MQQNDANRKQKLIIFVIAYHAEATLQKVLERVPKSVFVDFDTEILVVDDASADRTFTIGREYSAAHPEIMMHVMRNEYNRGYGGNQKVGYAFAKAKGADFVAMLHGDGQYAPEELPKLLLPLARGEADAVFGSRMIGAFSALRGGMPLYKFFGNRILTIAQNLLLGMRLSEFHSGYRLYRVSTLATLPIDLNSNDFHFDTEIIIQLANAKARIVELPIPTFYGAEICRVNGMKYAKDVMVATVKNFFHRLGLLYQRRFDTGFTDGSQYTAKLGYNSSHQAAIDSVKPGAHVVDIGSGSGYIAEALLQKGCTVTLVDQYVPKVASDASISFIQQNLNDPIQFSLERADYILMLDIIEHLTDPELFLQELRRRFDFQTRNLIVTTPNIAFIVIRLSLLFGQFNYGKAGILDRTHTRLFTFRSLRYLLRDAGLIIDELKGIPVPFPKVFGDGVLGRTLLACNEFLIRLSPSLFSYQIYARCRTTPDIRFILNHTQKASGIVQPISLPQ